MNFAVIPEGETGQLHRSAQTGASEGDTSLRCSESPSANEVKLSPCVLFACLIWMPDSCKKKKKKEQSSPFLTAGSAASVCSLLYFQQHELIRWQWKSFTLQTSVLTECTR